MKALKYFLALAIAALVAGCGGGEVATLSTQKVAAAQRALSATSVTSAAAAELLMDAAEAAYPTLFPPHQATQTFGAFAFRYYPQTNMYLGVVTAASAQYTLNGVYVVGNGFGTLDHPGYQGLVTNFINVDIGGGTTTGHTLVVTVNVMGVGSTFTIDNVPAPTAEGEFCSGLAADTTFTQIAAGAGGTLTINSCSFSGNTGSISATLTITSPYQYTVPYTINYTYQ